MSEQNKNEQEREAKKKNILRMSNAESNRFTKECIQTALIYLMNEMPFDKITITSIINRSVQAKMPPDFIFQTSLDTENKVKKLPPQERYRAIALQSAAKDILVKWFQYGMQETPKEMADICCELFHRY